VSGYVNEQNCRYWAPNNPRGLHQRPLHSAKVTVLCEVSSHDIIGPYCIENAKGCTVTVNADRYKFVPETFLRIELHYCQQDLLWFEQGSATACREHISMQLLRIMLPGKLISHFGNITWPTRSPDLTSSGATLQKSYTKHALPTLLT